MSSHEPPYTDHESFRVWCPLFKYAQHKKENKTLHRNGFQNKLSRLSTAI